MSFIHGRRDYHGGEAYTDYHRFEFIAQRARQIESLWSHLKGGSVLVAGCAFGFLVEELCQRGFDAWGVDASEYAVNEAAVRDLGDLADRIVLGDVTSADSLQGVLGMAGVERFSLVISEDVLPCAQDAAEATLMLENLRSIGERLHHFITPQANDLQSDFYLWLSEDEWESLVGSSDEIISWG